MKPFLFSTRRAEDQPVPEKADFVIVGGGVVGTSLAYHLAKQVEFGVSQSKQDILILLRGIL